MKKISNFIIAFAAFFITTYVLFNHFSTPESDTNQQRLNDYLANEGLDPQGEDVYMESDDYGAYAGMMAPPFRLPSWNDTGEIKLSDYEGNFIIVNAWASWCPPCRDEIPYLIEFHENYIDDKVVVLGINMTTADTNEASALAFIKEFNIPYEVAMDLNGYFLKEYEVLSMPMTFVVDPDGRIIIRKLGFMDYDMIVKLYDQAKEIYSQ